MATNNKPNRKPLSPEQRGRYLVEVFASMAEACQGLIELDRVIRDRRRGQRGER